MHKMGNDGTMEGENEKSLQIRKKMQAVKSNSIVKKGASACFAHGKSVE